MFASELFVGRSEELNILTEHGSGGGRVDLIAGEPGVGKTGLVAEYTGRLSADQCYAGGCIEGGKTPPYWPWVRVLSLIAEGMDLVAYAQDNLVGVELLRRLDATTFGQPELADDHLSLPNEQELLPVDLYLSVLHFIRSAASAPLTVVIEDLHWADPGTSELFLFLAREIERTPVHLIGTYRGTDLNLGSPFATAVPEILSLPNCSVIRLVGFTSQEVDLLLRQQGLPRDVEEIAAEIRRRTDGNPLFVRLLTADLDSESSLESLSQIPEGVRHLVGRQVAKLSHEQFDVVCHAAVVGQEFSISPLVKILAQYQAMDVTRAIDAAAQVGIVHQSRDRHGYYQFHHEVIRQAILEGLSLSRRVQIHGTCALALEQMRQDGDDVAVEALLHHFSESEVLHEPMRVAQYALASGDSALARLDIESARRCYTRGLESIGSRSVELFARLHIGLEHAELHRTLGRSRESTTHLKAAVEALIGAGETDLLKEQLTVLSPFFGTTPEVVPILEQVLPLVSDDPRLRIAATQAICLIPLSYGRPVTDDCLNAVERGWREAAELDAMFAAQLMTAANWISGHEGPEEKLERVVESRRLLEKAHHPRATGYGLPFMIAYLAEAGRTGEAVDLARRNEVLYLGRFREPQPMHFAARSINAYLAAADWAGIRRITSAVDRGSANYGRQVAPWMGLVAVELDRLDEAEELFALLPQSVYFSVLWRLMLVPMVRLATGANHLDGMLDEAFEADVDLSTRRAVSLSAAARAFLAMQRSDLEALRSFLPDIDPVQSNFGWRTLGMLQAGAGYTERAVATFETGLRRFPQDRPRAAWLHFFMSRTLTDADPVRSERELGLAAEQAELHGLALLARRVREARSNKSSTPRAAGSYGLTAREREVLTEIALGKTDAEIAGALFISTKTVSNHVGNILRKTRTGNRTEAARFGFEHGLVADADESRSATGPPKE